MADDVRLLDPSKEVIVIHNAPVTLVLILIIQVGFMLGGGWMAWMALSGLANGPGFPHPLVLAVSVPILGLLTITWLRRLVAIRSPAIVISPEGFWDHRLRGAPIPWSKITEIRTRVSTYKTFAVLSFTKETAKQLDLNWEISLWHRLDELVGLYRLQVSAVATNIRIDSLIPVLTAYWNAHHTTKESVNV